MLCESIITAKLFCTLVVVIKQIMDEFVRAFILLFAVIDPIGTVPVFLSATKKFDKATSKKVALTAILVAACILLFFIVIGQVLIEHMEISLEAFKVSGGLILLLFALTMIFSESAHDVKDGNVDFRHVAVFPLAIPSIASPGAILAVVLLTDNSLYTIGHQVMITGIVFVILAITLLFLLAAGRIQRAIGATGITVITKIMGLLLCSLAMESILSGVKAYFAAH